MSGLDENKTKLDMIRDIITNTSWSLSADSAYAYNLGIATENQKVVVKVRTLMDILFERKLVQYSHSIDFKLDGFDKDYKFWTYRDRTNKIWGVYMPHMSFDRLECVVKEFDLQINCEFLDKRIAKFEDNIVRFNDYKKRLMSSKGE